MTAPITELIDAGQATPRVWTDKINQLFCGRSNCKRTPEATHDFCSPCLSWLRAETEEDPVLADKVPEKVSTWAAGPFPPDVEGVDWEDYIAACSATGWANDWV
jgi:hypothetical protein